MVQTWGPRYYTVQVDGYLVKCVVRVGGVAGTRNPQRGVSQAPTDRRTSKEAESDQPPLWGAGGAEGADSGPLGAMTPSQRRQAEQRVRLALRRRLVARMSQGEQRPARGSSAEVAAREAQITTTGADVVAYRREHGLSQRDLAALVGVTRGTICECERGRRPGLRVREWVDGQR